MKDQYVGDINDYLKYALLRALMGSDVAFVVVWMLTRSDRRGDGRRVSYLSHPQRYRSLDPPLFDFLKNLVGRGQRDVRSVELAKILPGAAYVSGVLDEDPRKRQAYFEEVWRLARGRPMVFFDPDNGLAVGSVVKGRRNSSKYLYWDELEAAYAQGHSVVVYQHFPRLPRATFTRELLEHVQEATRCRSVLALTTPHVAFVVVPQPDAEESLTTRLSDFSLRAVAHQTAVISIPVAESMLQSRLSGVIAEECDRPALS